MAVRLDSTASHEKIACLTLCAHGHRLAVKVRAKYGSDSEYFDLDVGGPSSCAVLLFWGAGAFALLSLYMNERAHSVSRFYHSGGCSNSMP